MKKLLVFVSCFVFLASPALSFAQDAATTMTATSNDTTTTTPSVTTTTPNTKFPLRKPIAAAREDLKSDLKDKMQQAREEFKTKMAAIKDQRKQQLIANLDIRIATMNKNRTSEMSERLTRLTSILGKISTKEASLKAEGKNTTTLASDIAAAQSAIDTASKAVSEQAAKDYTMNITTDAALKSAASTVIQQYKTDITAVFLKVKAAHQAVVKAYKDLGQLMGVTPTPSAAVTTVTPTP